MRRARYALAIAPWLLLAPTRASAQSDAGAAGGDDFEVPATGARDDAGTADAGAPPDAAAPEVDARTRALEARLAQLEARVAALQARPAAPAPAPVQTAGAAPPSRRPDAPPFLIVGSSTVRPDDTSVLEPVGLVLSGYMQLQYVASQLSEDQLMPDGTPYNRDAFSVRRARLRLDGSWRYVATTFEIDGNTVHGPAFSIRRAEASVLLRGPSHGAPPLVTLTGGLMAIPFGAELPENSRHRVFAERSLGSLAFFRNDPDLGVRVSGGVRFFRYALAVMNGFPVDDHPTGLVTPPIAARDYLGRVGVELPITHDVEIAAGVSFLAGSGFHPGTAATKNTVQWRDLNENGAVDPGEIVAVPGQAATPSQTFAHWALNADAYLGFRTRAGWTRLRGEATMATNLDRGLFVSDPIAAGYDQRQFAGYASIVQEITRYALVGFRWDYYDPDADRSTLARGQVAPASLATHTLSPLVGVVLPGYGRLVAQYDVVLDSLAHDARGLPTDLANNQLTVRVQGEF